MSFWERLDSFGGALALVLGATPEQQVNVSYGQLASAADRFASVLPAAGGKRLGAILCTNSVAAITAYLGALRAGDAVMLLNEQTDPELLAHIMTRYAPDWIYQPGGAPQYAGFMARSQESGWVLLQGEGGEARVPLHPELAVLLSTSGTTGSPKMVRLSYANISSNAEAIVDYLGIDAATRAVSTLPFNYSFGMSVINSQLAAGASLLLTGDSLMSREFWDAFALHRVSLLPGVPYTWQMLQRLNPRKLPLDSLHTLIQAGGRLAPRLVEFFRELAAEKGWRFFVMYGQTEAAPRISYLPPEQLAAKAGSIGIAIPGGRLSLSEAGELIYEGPNVMMGYAENRSDLASGDELGGRLATGDLARCDEDGFYFIEGRLKRFLKIHGNRVNLDDIEQRLEAALLHPVAVLGEDDKLQIFLSAGADEQAARALLSGTYHLHPTTFALKPIEAIPHTSSGKKDYASLKA
jgi:acyl-CoA synthetase (AMP-forming)/AMP-acid ligase II